MKIESFLTQSLQYIFVNHIRLEAKVFNITQIESNKGGIQSAPTQ